MAELFGIAASSIAVAEVAVKAGGAIPKLKRLWDEIQNVPETISDLMKEIDILDPLIWEMEAEINERRASINSLLFNDTALRRSTEFCREAMNSLTRLVDDLRIQVDTEKKLKRRMGKLKVVLKARTIADYERRLEKAVSILKLAQNSYMMALMKLQPHMILQQLKDSESQPSSILPDTSEQDKESTYTIASPMGLVEVENHGIELQKNATAVKSPVVSTRTRHSHLSSSHTFFGAVTTCKAEKVDSLSFLPETRFDIRIQPPSWIVRKVWEVQLTKAISGWGFCLRTWHMVDDLLSPAFNAVRNSDTELLQELFRNGLASPFMVNKMGDTLLHYAFDADCIQLLLNCGLDIEERGSSLYRPIENIFRELPHPLRDLNGARKTFEFLATINCSLDAHRYLHEYSLFAYTYVFTCFLFRRGNVTPPYHCIKPNYESPFRDRLWQVVTVIWGCGMAIPAKALCHYLWPGGIIQRDDIKKLEQSDVPFINLVAFAISSGYDPVVGLARQDFLEWKEVVRETLCVSENLHYFHRHPGPYHFASMSSALYEGTPLICFISNRTEDDDDNYWRRPGIIHRALLQWLSLLKECQVDLMKYGKKERKTLMDNYINTASPREWYRIDGWYLKDIRYGASLEDWSLVLDIRVEEFAGEFWGMVETPRFPMPGTWVDD